MVNKKYLLLTGLCSVLALQPVIAQESQSTSAKWGSRDMTYRGESYDVLDSNYVPRKRMEQHRKYLNHQYAFPAKPRSMWEIGVKGGLYNVSGDVPSLLPWQKGGFGLGAHIRKAWGYTFSTRLEYTYGIAKGLAWQPTGNYSRNSAWMQSGLYAPVTTIGGAFDPVYDNYRMEAHALNLDVIASLANIRFHKASSGVSFYVFAGLGGFAYKTYVNTVNDAYQKYDFASVYAAYPSTESHRKDIRNKLQGMMDKSYETDAESYVGRRSTMGNKVLEFEYSFGAGMQFKLNRRVNIAVEDRVLTPWSDDLLDGERWAAQVSGAPVLTPKNDGVNFLSVGLNFNLGNMHKKVLPLYWLNPLDHLYNEIGYPRHMILPEPILSDADGDGIADQFDKCPGTPAGVAVDSHGCPMDTDGDGVPDDRDKELITPTYCQPVDADGVGKCPCPEGCGTVAASACGNIGAGSVTFDRNMSRIRPASQAQLATLAAQMQANPTCKVVITGAGNASKMEQQRSWDRVNAIIEYMSEKHGIDRNRFIFQYGQAGDANGVMYRSAMSGEEGPANVAPPFPNLKK